MIEILSSPALAASSAIFVAVFILLAVFMDHARNELLDGKAGANLLSLKLEILKWAFLAAALTSILICSGSTILMISVAMPKFDTDYTTEIDAKNYELQKKKQDEGKLFKPTLIEKPKEKK